MKGIETTLKLYKFYDGCAGMITNILIDKGYGFRPVPMGGKDVMFDNNTWSLFYDMVESLQIERQGMKDQIFWRVKHNLLNHSRGKKIEYQ